MTNLAQLRNNSSRPLYWSPEISGRFRIIASLLYLAAMGAHLIYVWRSDCGFAFITGGPAFFVGLLVGMMGFEVWAHRRYAGRMTRQIGFWLLGTRIVLYEIAASMDCTSFAIIFYMLLPFLAYLFIDRWAAVTLSVVFVAWTTYKVGVFRCLECPLDQRVTPIILLAFGMMWSTGMGGLVRQLEATRTKTRQLLADLNRSHQSLKRYTGRIEELTAAEERNRLARDIHDSVGHSLAVVNVQLERALVYQAHDPEVTREAMQHARGAAREAMRDVRESVRTLREADEVFSLAAALERLKQSAGELAVDLQVHGDETEFPQPILMALYRAAQEGLTNVYKHAEAGRVEIIVHLGDNAVVMEIRDDGRGFDPQTFAGLPPDRPGQYGLQGIRERLELAGGKLEIESAAGRGTRLVMTLPGNKLKGPLNAEGEMREAVD